MILVELQETMGSDRAIAEAAWTSSLTLQKKDSRSEEDVARVVKMLADSRHSTPFESVILKFWIKMPIQTDRQHMTHRIASHNGMSGRYRTMPDEYMIMPEDVSGILKKAERDSIEWAYAKICENSNVNFRAWLEILKKSEASGQISNAEYKRCREFLRGVLPQNNMTERVTVMNLRSFANYQKLRNSPHAQPEIQEVAKQMLKSVIDAGICPIALEALQLNGWNI